MKIKEKQDKLRTNRDSTKQPMPKKV